MVKKGGVQFPKIKIIFQIGVDKYSIRCYTIIARGEEKGKVNTMMRTVEQMKADLTKQLREFHATEEYKNWIANPTEENLMKAKAIRKQIVK